MDKRKALGLALLATAAGAAWWSARRDGPGDAGAGPVTDGGVVDAITGEAQQLYEGIVAAVTPGPWTPPASAAPYVDAIYAAEDRYGITRNLLARLLYQESHYRADIISGRTRSSAGALGIAQFMPATAADLGIDPLDPAQAIDAAGRYLSQLYRATGDWRLALAAYNWGLGNVQRKGMAAAPAETVAYVSGIAGDVGIA